MTAAQILKEEQRELEARRKAMAADPKAEPWFLTQLQFVKNLMGNGNS